MLLLDKSDKVSKGLGMIGEYDIFNPQDFLDLLIRFSFNFLVVFIIVRFIYYPMNKNKEYLFTYLVFNVAIFFVVYLLSDLKVKTGFGIGLFAVFSILRYRTDAIPIKEMTFLFVCIIVGVLNALFSDKSTLAEVGFVNLMIIMVTLVLERIWLKRSHDFKIITYENVELIKPEHKEKLIADLEERTGLKVQSFELIKIDYLRDVATIKMYHGDS